jgi:hypothetical protein
MEPQGRAEDPNCSNINRFDASWWRLIRNGPHGKNG